MAAVVWFKEVEYLRGFAALAVIAVHVSMNYTRVPGVNLLALLDVTVYILAHFAVPVFIFISGWVLAARYFGEYSFPDYYRRRARTILLPYLFFSGLYLMVAVEGTIGFAGVPAPDAVAEALLLGTAAYHLWFFVLIIQLYLLFPLIARGYDAFDRGGAALFLLLALLFFQVLWNVGAHLTGAFAGTEWYTVLIRFFPSHLFYFVLGIYVARHTDRFRSAVRSLSPAGVLAAAGGGALLLGGMWMAAVLLFGSISGSSLAVFCIYRIIEPLYYVPVIVVLVLAAWRLERTGGRPAGASRSFGEHSYGIYLIHPLVIAACAAAWTSLSGLGWADWVTYPVLFLATAAVSYGVVRGASGVPYAGYLLGESRVRKME
ncbi:acyltransferase [Methanoculleus sp.]|uniref:acyltransferase n=1 Tax=Methanoculleus sp. TaxID=90427 RepID=UPI00272DF9C3|nr:acyltransferase [Methanoculleus sp.]